VVLDLSESLPWEAIGLIDSNRDSNPSVIRSTMVDNARTNLRIRSSILLPGSTFTQVSDGAVPPLTPRSPD